MLDIKIVKKEIAQERFNICKSCDQISAIKLCRICNCVMPVKVKFAHAACPKGKWPAQIDPENHQFDAYEDLR